MRMVFKNGHRQKVLWMMKEYLEVTEPAAIAEFFNVRCCCMKDD